MIVDKIEPSLGDVVILSYDGDFDDDGYYDGKGEATLDNECTYVGSFKHGMFQGKGVFTWPNGVKFEGEFDRGVISGKGTYSWYDGSSFQGGVEGGQRSGTGKFIASSGQFYEGDWSKGMRHGNGKVFYNDTKTSHYTGQWVANLREGYGTMKYVSGNTYEGEWVADKKCGLGVMTWRDVDEIYTGQWQNDRPHGYGEHIWGEGSAKMLKKQLCNMYRGEFKEGKRHGLGTFFYMNGSQYTGYWQDDKKHGEGVYVQQDGKIVAGEYEENRFLSTNNDTSVHIPRATDDVNPQYMLNITDVVAAFPKTPSTKQQPMVKSNEDQIKEVERLLLKYNSYVKQAYRRYADFANVRRIAEAKAAAAALKASSKDSAVIAKQAQLTNGERAMNAIFNGRNFQKRLSCASVDQLLRFMREGGFAGPFLRSYDIKNVLRKMRSHHNTVAAHALFESTKRLWYHRNPAEPIEAPLPLVMPPGYAAAAAQLANPDAKPKPVAGQKKKPKSPEELAAIMAAAEQAQVEHAAATAEYNAKMEQQAREREVEMLADITGGVYSQLKLASVLDNYGMAVNLDISTDSDFSVSPQQPLLEREFIEAIVRCVAVQCSKKSLASGKRPSLYHGVYEALGNNLLPLTADWTAGAPAFYQAFYHDSVQNAIYGATHVMAAKKGHHGHGGIKGGANSNVASAASLPPPPTSDAAATAIGSSASAEPVPKAVLLLEQLWKAVLDMASRPDAAASQLCVSSSGVTDLNPRGGSVELRHFIAYMQSTSGVLLKAEPSGAPASVESILRVCNCLAPNCSDFSVSFGRVDFEDFVDMMCRLVASDLWIYDPATAAAAKAAETAAPTDADAGADGTADGSAAAAATTAAATSSSSSSEEVKDGTNKAEEKGDSSAVAAPATDGGVDGDATDGEQRPEEDGDAAPAAVAVEQEPLHKTLSERIVVFSSFYKL